MLCLCGWLISQMDKSENEAFMQTHTKSMSKWSLVELKELLDVYIRKQWTSTLAIGFDIFQKVSSILIQEIFELIFLRIIFVFIDITVVAALVRWCTVTFTVYLLTNPNIYICFYTGFSTITFFEIC